MKRLIGFGLLLLLTGCASQSMMKQMAQYGTDMARQGFWREAEYRWRQALELDPDNYKLINNLAVAAEVRGDYEEARELYEKARKLAPGDKTVEKNDEASKRFLESQQPADQ